MMKKNFEGNSYNIEKFDDNTINIPNEEIFSICQRCKTKESVFSCIVCESFKFLCTKCDNYIHSLPSKQSHQRLAILSNKSQEKAENSKKDESKIIKLEEMQYNSSNYQNINNNYTDLNYKFNLSPINRLNTINKDKDMSEGDYNTLINQKSIAYNNTSISMNRNTHEKKDATENDAYGNNYDTNYSNNNKNKSNYINIQENTFSNNFSSFKIPNAQTFSREYLYEIKTIFDKDKSELLYKINSLQMTTERLKLNFTEQINYLNNQLEDVNKRSNITIKQLQDNCDERIKQISDERDSQYEEFKTKLQELENINRELSNKLEENIRNICDIKTATNLKQSELEIEIRKKDDELAKQKNQHENKINEVRKYLEDDKLKLMESYDKNINLLIAEFDQTKDKLNKLLKERENDLRSMIEKHKIELDKLLNLNKELNKEIECHKMNIISIRNKSEDEKNELEYLREENDSMKRELRFQMSELKMLDGQTKSLMKENEDLKIQISKLDKLVYGKIRISNMK